MTQTVTCPRYLKTRETLAFDTKWHPYPSSVSARERETTMTKDVYQSYEECSGDVPVHDDGSFGTCPDCGGKDWSTADRATLTLSLTERPHVG